METLHSCITWSKDHLGHLPGATPEEAIAAASAPDISVPGDGWKAHWLDKVRTEQRLTASEAVTAEQVLNSQRTALANLDDNCGMLRDIYETVDRIIEW